ncbi:MAG: PAS domain S-box protein, partial [Flavobacterium sp.]|nr:PAS domain S-box protein [Flavobacterium sp.]
MSSIHYKESNLHTNDLVSLEDSFATLLTYLKEECNIAFILFSTEVENSALKIKKGDLDVNSISNKIGEYSEKVKQLKEPYIITEQLSNEVTFLALYPIKTEENIVIGTLSLLHFVSKIFTISELRLIEFTVNQIQSFLKVFLKNIKLTKELNNRFNKFDSFAINSKEIFYELNQSGEILYISESWELGTGYTINEVIGKRTVEYIHPDDIQKVGEFLSKIELNQKSNESITYRIQHKNGHYIWHSSNVKLVERDGTLFYIGNCRDVTDFIEAQEEI